MDVSFISRHVIIDNLHQYLFIIHDVYIPLFFLCMLYQFSKYRHYHQIIGKITCLSIIPVLVFSGYFLSKYSKKKIIFETYGISFLSFYFEIMNQFYRISSKLRILLHVFSLYNYIKTYIFLVETFYENMDFFFILFFIPILHYISLQPRSHVFYAHSILYLSLLGTFFSFTKDTYWIRKTNLHFFIKTVINNIPFFILIQKLKKIL